MEQLSAAAFAISLVGGMHDLLTRRIPNWLTFPAMLLGLIGQAWLFGASGALDSLLGILLGLAVLLPVYLLGYMGAGDVKLLMAVGAWLGWRLCWRVALFSILCGAAYAAAEIVIRGRALEVARRTYSFIRALLVPGLVAEKLRLDESRKFAFGICITLAVALVTVLRHQGRLP
jgi:prepilin peptidase CpaA